MSVIINELEVVVDSAEPPRARGARSSCAGAKASTRGHQRRRRTTRTCARARAGALSHASTIRRPWPLLGPTDLQGRRDGASCARRGCARADGGRDHCRSLPLRGDVHELGSDQSGHRLPVLRSTGARVRKAVRHRGRGRSVDRHDLRWTHQRTRGPVPPAASARSAGVRGRPPAGLAHDAPDAHVSGPDRFGSLSAHCIAARPPGQCRRQRSDAQDPRASEPERPGALA